MQLFSWRIGQAIAYAGGRIVSTNTDGLYSVLESELNNKILAHEAESINVQIDPEPMYLISKDTNNRVEMDPDSGNICGASGGSLACRKGPHVTKSLTHPAAIDWALTEYLVVASMHSKPGLSLMADFDTTTGANILKHMPNKFDKVGLLRMYQNVIASSVGSVNYIFGTTDDNPGKPIILQHYNRVFIMKDGTPGTMHLHSANARVVTAAQQQKRQKNNERMQQHDSLAVQVLGAHGVTLSSIPSNKEAVVKKVTNIEDTWCMYVCNKDLHYLSDEEVTFILDNLDYDKYLNMLRDSYEDNWRNHMPKDYVDPNMIPVVQPEPESGPVVDATEPDAPPVIVTADSDNIPTDVTSDVEPAETKTSPVEIIPEQSSEQCSIATEQYNTVAEQLSETDCSDNIPDEPVDEPIADEVPVTHKSTAKSEPQSECCKTRDEIIPSNAATQQPPVAEQPSERKPNAAIMDILDGADLQTIMDTSDITLTVLDKNKATFTFTTRDPDLVHKLFELLY